MSMTFNGHFCCGWLLAACQGRKNTNTFSNQARNSGGNQRRDIESEERSIGQTAAFAAKMHCQTSGIQPVVPITRMRESRAPRIRGGTRIGRKEKAVAGVGPSTRSGRPTVTRKNPAKKDDVILRTSGNTSAAPAEHQYRRHCPAPKKRSVMINQGGDRIAWRYRHTTSQSGAQNRFLLYNHNE